MDNLEKVEKLRQRANVTYEEAKEALEANGWDLLDAMVALEKQGKTESPSKSDFSTSYEQQDNYEKVQEKVEIQRKSRPHPVRSIFTAIRRFIRICIDNSFTISRKGERIFQMPIIVPVILLLINWKVVLIVMAVALFFGFRYTFEGKDQPEMEKANSFMDSASNIAESMKEGFFDKDRKRSAKAETAKDAAQETVRTQPAAEAPVVKASPETVTENVFETTAETVTDNVFEAAEHTADSAADAQAF